MKVNRVILAATVAAISAVAVSSCAYDPYYSGSPYSSGPSYASGYGRGYGYGGRNFTTTYFVSTGNSRWGYDPYARCYYDYSRRCYYDPYLYGYYPVGYRPRYVHGAPHPHGWSSRSRYIAPPSRIRDYRLDNYENRTDGYRSLNNDWSRNVQVNSQTRVAESYPDRRTSNDRMMESRQPSYQRSNQVDPRSRTSDRSRETYVNESQNSRRTDSRMVQPPQESPRSSRPEQMNQTERPTRSTRQAEPPQERESRRSEAVSPEATRQSGSRSGESRATEKRQREQSDSSSTEGVDDRYNRRR